MNATHHLPIVNDANAVCIIIRWWYCAQAGSCLQTFFSDWRPELWSLLWMVGGVGRNLDHVSLGKTVMSSFVYFVVCHPGSWLTLLVQWNEENGLCASLNGINQSKIGACNNGMKVSILYWNWYLGESMNTRGWETKLKSQPNMIWQGTIGNHCNYQ